MKTTERILKGSIYESRVQAGKDFENALKMILKDNGWKVLPTDGRPTDVLAELNGYRLLIEARDIERANVQVTQEGRITTWKYGRPYPFRTAPYFKAKERDKPNLAIIVTTATVNFLEHEAIAIINETPIKVMNYKHFKSWIHAHTGRIGPGKLTDYLPQMPA